MSVFICGLYSGKYTDIKCCMYALLAFPTWKWSYFSMFIYLCGSFVEIWHCLCLCMCYEDQIPTAYGNVGGIHVHNVHILSP